MSRGSKPGERRGGRQRRIPNKRTVLRDRILALAPAKPTGTFREFVPILVCDQALPDDIRIAIVRKVPSEKLSKKEKVPAKRTIATEAQTVGFDTRSKSDKDVATMFAKLDLLMHIVRDKAATEGGRRKAAAEVAEFFLPKTRGRKLIKFPTDEFGFSADPKMATEFRDIKWKIACSNFKGDKLAPDAFARKVTKLQERLAEIRRVLQPPDPSRYSKQALEFDEGRLEILRKRRASNVIFSPEEDAEEAHRMARVASFLAGPEMVARSRLEELHQKYLSFKRSGGPPLTRLEADNYRFLSTFYPLDPPSVPFREYFCVSSRIVRIDGEWLSPRVVGDGALLEAGLE